MSGLGSERLFHPAGDDADIAVAILTIVPAAAVEPTLRPAEAEAVAVRVASFRTRDLAREDIAARGLVGERRASQVGNRAEVGEVILRQLETLANLREKRALLIHSLACGIAQERGDE